MYKIKTADKTLYTDAIRYIRLHKNGCYVACLDDVAEGICVKVHEDRDEVGTVLGDTVFALYEGGMRGNEPVCVSMEQDPEITVEELYKGQHAQDVLGILLEAGAITNAQASSYRAIIEQAMQFTTDEVALAAIPLFPVWVSGVEYTLDQRVKYNDVLYRCISTHTSQDDWMPEVTPSLWAKVLIPDANVIPKWEQPDSTNPYMNSDKVTHNEKTWVSIVDNNVWEPGVYGWEEII